ncbi:xanthine dehydrogenase family protein subunit M [Amycolatopsis rubida]|uniref:Xanthine dehydrogenase family protein subunit M n=1 Tax=Amycolatopsis rubida TaxID=112413 RepID=A0ABX0BKE5_9PSEU|nr:xanthine dehydrogenase family protein subunit M [Amycolatopsis sp. M39]MYW90773.1 xanthine dehydrogenase family protein subunit M [Amycolatopsis rubida]NEC55756.1 xanthine dehydrogenase family protein subunit M [Amycolatopsis rubida]OAP26172.1 4-hydroxybenzoyl-CoA reductase subunit beta [Amycolatopsis sp. M39]
MKPFAYVRPETAADAVAAVAVEGDAAFLAGGTNLVDHLKLGIRTPSTLVDVTRVTSGEITDLADGGIRIGAGVRNSDLAADRRVRARYPMLAQAVLAGASGQLRNMATSGGNLLQRTRCPYFTDHTTPCTKRSLDESCSALGGWARNQAILGASEHCIATHPSDMAVALAALDARVNILGPNGKRTIPITEFHRLPGDDPTRDTVLEHGELITAIDLPSIPMATRSAYRKVRDRASYAFALISVAAALEVAEGPGGPTVTDVRLAFGGVAHKPWRATRAEAALRGSATTDEAFRAAAEAELADAVPLESPLGGNGFKVPLLIGTVTTTLRRLAKEGS